MQHTRKKSLPNAVRRHVAVEMVQLKTGTEYVGLDGAVLGIDTLDICPSTKSLGRVRVYLKTSRSHSKLEIIPRNQGENSDFLI